MSRRLGAALAVTMALLQIACGPAVPATTSSRSPERTPAAASVGPTASTPFPISVTDGEGAAVAIPAAPQRIVSLTPGATETLFALGAGNRVVATDSASDYPSVAAGLPDVAAFGSVDVRSSR